MILNDQKKKIVDLEHELKSANEHIQYLSQLNQDKDINIQKLTRKFEKQ